MFFAKQKSQQCGLHAIQNVLKTGAITRQDMDSACKSIHEQTGDAIQNQQAYTGDWSVSAVLQALRARDFEVYQAVETKQDREWKGPSMDELVQDEMFQGIILHQPLQRHFTCIRPEDENGQKNLYYVDSQSSGPRRISSRLATRRCLANAYAWEPFVVKGKDIEYVPPNNVPDVPELPDVNQFNERPREKPSEEFLQAWRSFNQQQAQLAQPHADDM